MKESKYSTETILRYREMMGAGHFDRKVTGRTPSDLMHDKLTLECGHTQLTYAGFEREGAPVHCDECAKAWLKENGK